MRRSRIVILAEAKNLTHIRNFTTAYAQRNRFSREEMNRLKISVDEICSNIVRYAYEGMERGDIQVRIQRRKNRMTVKILDSGAAFDPSSIEAPDLSKFVQEKKRGGIGFHLVKKLNDDQVFYKRVGNQNVITIHRIIKPTVLKNSTA